MFTGLIEAVGLVTRVASRGGGVELEIGISAPFEVLEGQSVAVSGACLTVERRSGAGFVVFASQETLARTTLGLLKVGARVNLERALEHAENEDAVAALREGVELTLKEFRKILNKYEVREIEALGKPFDPFYHDAMSQIEREDVEDKTVVEEYRKGYMLKDKVIRPSLVGVSKKVEPSSEGESEQKDK